MAEDEVFVDGSELISVERCRERVHRLFGVTCETAFIALGSNEPCRIRLQCFDVDAQENIEKAKRYLESVGSSDGVVNKELRVDQQHFEMVQGHNDAIEKQFQVFLDLQTPCTVKLRGNPDNIKKAEEFVSGFLSTQSNHEGCELETLNSSTSDYFTDGSLLSPTASDFVQSDEGIVKTESFGSSQGYSARNEHLKARGSAEMSRTPVSFLQGERCSSESYGSGSLSSHSDTPDSESDLAKFMATPEYTARLGKALKLGYTEDQLIQALQKLGFDADQNQVLSEMIKLGSSAKVSLDETKDAGDRTESFEDETSCEQTKEIIDDSSNLRHIVIDGSNVAMSHGKEVFSCQGIKIAVDWFRERGHENITVFVPQWRKETSRPDAPITDQEILTQLEREGVLAFTPARRVGGRRMVCYDDRYILNLAADEDGIVVSNDNYRDLLNEKAEFKKVVEERLLMYTFVSNRFMPPDDPLGRKGPSLDNFLRKEHTIPEPLPPKCPYEKKCTYGNKCRYYHPERKNRPHQSITDKLQEQAKQKWQERASRPSDSASIDKKRVKEPVKNPMKKPLARTSSVFPPGLPDELIAPVVESTEQILKEEYNEKLNEARKKLERAQLNRKAYVPEEEQSVHAASRQTPSYDFSQSQQENQLKVPHSQPKEGLVSGHLLLAKKLSDEAQDSSFFRSEGSASSEEMCRSSPQSFSYPSSPCRPVSVSHLSSGIADIPYYPGQEPTQRPVSASRDRSPRHMLKDSGACHSVPSMLMRQDTSMSFDYGPQYRSFPLPNSGYQTKPEQLMYPGQDEYYEHSSVNRYPSAPGASHLRHVSSMPQMQRQNSTSDPQLHMVGESELAGRPSGQGYQRQALQHQLNPYGQINEGYGQGQGYGYQSWGESDPSSHAGLRPIQKSFPVGPSGQFSPAGQERALSAEFGRSSNWGSQMSPIPPNQPYNPTPRISNLPYQQHMPQQMSQQMPQQMSHQISHQMPQMSSQPISYQRYAPDAPIEPTDPRYTMFYHLCGLFPKNKVLAVMNQHPTETDPKVLCSYIMSYGERI